MPQFNNVWLKSLLSIFRITFTTVDEVHEMRLCNRGLYCALIRLGVGNTRKLLVAVSSIEFQRKFVHQIRRS
jgi:hypothetical protein